MSDWQIGDRAVCVLDGSDWSGRIYGGKPAAAPQKAAVYFVHGIRLRGGEPFLILAGFGDKGWASRGFRKVVQDAHEACEEEFVTLLKRAKVPTNA